jgi:hypothetical protein
MQIKMDLEKEMTGDMLFVKRGMLNKKNNKPHFSRGNTPMD